MGLCLQMGGSALAQSDVIEGAADPAGDLVGAIRATCRASGTSSSTTGRSTRPPAACRTRPRSGKAERDKRVAAEEGRPLADASAYCWPHGTPRVMNSPYPIQIIQTKGKTTIVHEVAHNIRHIYMDQQHPANVPTSFMGDSVGKWEGDTLVIDTVGTDPRTWIDEDRPDPRQAAAHASSASARSRTARRWRT